MANVARIPIQANVGIGGVATSHVAFTIAGGGVPAVSDCNSAGAAIAAFYNAVKAYIPGSVAWQVDGAVEVFDVDSGAPTANLIMSSVPSLVTGTDSINFPGGMGARVNWKTSTIFGRRFVRGSLFVVPLGGAAYENTDGSLKPALQTLMVTSAATYIGAMASASVIPVVYCRPKVHQVTGGHTATIVSAEVTATPAGLRSRRT